MRKKFKEKVVIVTGGASGIGEATVRAFFAEGAKVVVADYDDKGQKIVDELNNERSKSSLFVKVDVSNEEQSIEMIKKTVDTFGKVDIMFANAGVARDNHIDQLSYSDWQRTIDINLSGVFLSDKYAIEQMLKQDTGGVIVNCGSIHSLVGKPRITAYSAAKGGIKLLTQTLGATYASRNIRVNAVAPAYIDTPLIKELKGEIRDDLIKLHPIGRLGKPEEVAATVLFLSSDAASFINGTILSVDGGYTAV